MKGPDCPEEIPLSLIGNLKPDATLLAQGWEQRFLADSPRAKEAEELYRSLGYEVILARLQPSDFDDRCAECSSLICRSYVMIYTRKT